MVTQIQIARRCGIDVSSVNKILNEVPGPVFAKETKKHVFQVAKEMGYPLKRETKHSLRREKSELKRLLAEFLKSYRLGNPVAVDDIAAAALICDPKPEVKKRAIG